MKPMPVLKYTEFYNTEFPADPFALLRIYPTDLIVLRLSKINSILFNEPDQDFESQKTIFQQCFPLLSQQKRARVAAQFLDDNSLRPISFFTAPTIVKLINLAFQNYYPPPEQEEQFNTEKFEDDLFDSILIQNDLYYNDISADQNLQTYEAIWHLQLMQQQYVRRHSNLIMIAPIKNMMFYKFLTTKFPGGREYIGQFCRKLGIQGYFNYYFFFMDILQKVFNSYKEKDAKHILDLSSGEQTIVQKFSIKTGDFKNGKYEGNIHKELMPKPFYYMLEKHPVIIDFHFFEQIVDLALAYNFYNFSSLRRSSRFPDFKDFKSELGKNYYEGFIMKSIFEKIYRAKNFSVYHACDNSPLSDFVIIRNQREAIFIEVKSAEIHFNFLEDLDIDGFKNFLATNFCNKKDGVGTKNRGVYQLVKQIEELASTKKLDSIIRNPSEKRKLTIYPVIIYVENTLDMAGVNGYLDELFEKEIQPYKKDFRKIYPLITINLNFFLRHYKKLKDNPRLFFETITAYVKTISKKQKEYEKRPHPMSFFEKNISFDQYLNGRFKTDDFQENFKEIVEDLELNVD